MSLPIFISKLYIPRPDAVITWPHLFEQLNDGLDRNLILVTSPACSGKASLISAWLREINLPVV